MFRSIKRTYFMISNFKDGFGYVLSHNLKKIKSLLSCLGCFLILLKLKMYIRGFLHCIYEVCKLLQVLKYFENKMQMLIYSIQC